MRACGGRAFSFYLASQGISNLGDSFRFITVTLLMVKLTGSGMGAATGLALSTLPGIFLSPVAGAAGDRFDERFILIASDFAKFMVVPLFLQIENICHIYLLLILLSLLDSVYNPSRRKFIRRMTGRNGALKANSLLTGVSGAAYLVGPLTAGFLADTCGIASAVLLAAFCCLCSGLLTVAAGIIYAKDIGKCAGTMASSFADELRIGFEYCLSSPDIKDLLIVGLTVGFGVISINLTFYPFAFDVLKVTARGWSLMITVYYGTNLLAMLMMKFLGKKCGKSTGALFYGGLCIVSVIWALYAFVKNLAGIILLQFVEGIVMAMCGILLAARLQFVARNGFMARVSGVGEIFANLGKLAGMGCTILISRNFTYGAVFVLNSALLLLLGFSGLVCSRWARGSPTSSADSGI